jgi:hypothetical protein
MADLTIKARLQYSFALPSATVSGATMFSVPFGSSSYTKETIDIERKNPYTILRLSHPKNCYL